MPLIRLPFGESYYLSDQELAACKEDIDFLVRFYDRIVYIFMDIYRDFPLPDMNDFDLIEEDIRNIVYFSILNLMNPSSPFNVIRQRKIAQEITRVETLYRNPFEGRPW